MRLATPTFCLLAGLACAPPSSAVVEVDLAAPLAHVNPRSPGVALDTSQVVGARWWGPDPTVQGGFGQTRVAPYDFSRPRLRQLTRALGPGVLRVGGSEADLLFYDLGSQLGAQLPPGDDAALTADRWAALVDFAIEVDAPILFTLNAGAGPRDGGTGPWSSENAEALLQFAADRHDPVLAWEFGNEVNGYRFVLGTASLTAQTYADDFGRLASIVERVTPGARLVGPASAFWPVIGEVSPVLPDFVTRLGAQLQAVSWHYYPQESRRCPAHVRLAGPDVMQHAVALDDMGHWAHQIASHLADVAPQAESWVSETGNAQCGGEPGVSDRTAGTWWWLDTLGQLAANGQTLVIRQTLSGSNYGLLDDVTLEPRPDYWATLLWKRLMGPTVLKARSSSSTVRAWAHCGPAGGVLAGL